MMGTNNLDRRYFLTGAAAATATATVATAAMPGTAHFTSNRAAWDAAMHQADKAKRTYEAFEALHGVNAMLIAGPISDQYDRLVGHYSDCTNRLMACPAPDRAALRWKLDHIFEIECDNDETAGWSRDYLRQLFADYQRLLGDA